MNHRSLVKTSGVIAVVLVMADPGSATAGGLVETDAVAFADATFTADSADITNPWWTLPAGHNFLYRAVEEDGCAWNLVEVLGDTTDNFEGVYAFTEARIILDREWLDEECEYANFADVWMNSPVKEQTYDWYAQDTDANVWYMGEDTRDDEGSSEGSFVAGCDGAEAGIVMLGDPQEGAFYSQEFYEDEAEDRGKVLNFSKDKDNGVTCLKTKEWTPLEPGSIEHKFYCSDGTTGELHVIHQLKGKTVVVNLIDWDVAAPPVPAPGPGIPDPVPSCL